MAQFDNQQLHAQSIFAKGRAKMNRRRLLQGAAGAATLPLASRVAPARAMPQHTLSNPAAVAAAQRVLQETGDSAEAAVAAAQQYSGVTLNYLSESALMAEGPKNFSGPKWQELTGITVNVVEKPFPELFPTMVQEHIAATGGLDVLDVVPAWMADMVGQGIVEPLDPFIEKYMNPADLDDFHPVYRDLMNYGGNIYGLFDDGDTFLLYYRTDLFEDPANQEAFAASHDWALAPPTTWEEYDAVQAFFTEQGTASTGAASASASRPRSINGGWSSSAPAAANSSTKRRWTRRSIRRPASIRQRGCWHRTRRCRQASKSLISPGVLKIWLEGKVAMVGGTWPPFGRFSEGYGAETVQMEWVPPSAVVGKVGYAVLPDGYSSLASAFMLSVSSDSRNKDAAYLFAQWMNSPTISLERVMLPYTLRDPFRLSHYESEAYRAPLAKGW